MHFLRRNLMLVLQGQTPYVARLVPNFPPVVEASIPTPENDSKSLYNDLPLPEV